MGYQDQQQVLFQHHHLVLYHCLVGHLHEHHHYHFIITRWMFVTRLSFSIRKRNIIVIFKRFFYLRFTRGMQSTIIFLLLFLFRRTRCTSINSLRVLFNSFRVSIRIKWFLSHFASSSCYSNSIIIHIINYSFHLAIHSKI